jgi:hypothetical protein
MSRPTTPPRTVLGREAEPVVPPSGTKLRWQATRMMVLVAVLVLLMVFEAYLTRAGYLLPLPPMP